MLGGTHIIQLKFQIQPSAKVIFIPSVKVIFIRISLQYNDHFQIKGTNIRTIHQSSRLNKREMHAVIQICQKSFWQPLLFLYQMFTINAFSVANLQNRKAKNILLLAYHLSFIAIIILTIAYVLIVRVPAAKNLHYGMDVLLTMSILIAHLVTVVEAVVTRHLCIDLTIRIGQIFLLFVTKPLDTNRLRSWYIHKCWITLLLVVAMKCIGALWFWNPMFLPIFFSWHVIHVRCIQISMYVDMITRLLRTLNVEMNEKNERTVMKRLVKVKTVFAAVQQAKRIICGTFGLSLIFIVTEYIIELTNCVYWIILSVFVFHSPPHLISNNKNMIKMNL